MYRFGPLTAGALILLAACQRPETPEQAQMRMQQETAAARQAIEAQSAKFARFFNAGRADSVASLYVQGGHLLPPNNAIVGGRDSIQAFWGGMLGQGTWNVQLTTDAVMANGPLAVERGRYALTFTPGPGAAAGMTAMKDQGKYMVHWHQVSGQWLLADDIWNSDMPLPAPAAAKPMGKRKK